MCYAGTIVSVHWLLTFFSVILASYLYIIYYVYSFGYVAVMFAVCNDESLMTCIIGIKTSTRCWKYCDSLDHPYEL